MFPETYLRYDIPINEMSLIVERNEGYDWKNLYW